MKQAVFDGYSFSNARGEFMVYRGQWWIVSRMGNEIVGNWPSEDDLLWLDTFTKICPTPEAPVQ